MDRRDDQKGPGPQRKAAKGGNPPSRPDRFVEFLDHAWPVVSRYGGMLGLAWSMVVDKAEHPQYLPLFAGLMMLDRVVSIQKKAKDADP